MAYLRFNDGSQRDLGSWGRAITGSPPAAPAVSSQTRLASQFVGWTPFDLERADVVSVMGTGALVAFDRANEIPGATFTVAGIRNDSTGQDTMTRLERHLRRGGTVAVYTEDRADRSYTTCGLQEGTRVRIAVRGDGRFADLTLSLVNLAASPSKMLADYT